MSGSLPQRLAIQLCKMSAQALDEVVVIFVRADPEPDDQVVGPSGQRTVRRPDPHRPDVTEQRLKLQRRVKGISLPEPVLFPSARLHLFRQAIEMCPEVTVRPRCHGISRSFPAWMSSSTSRRMWSSLPAATSRFICSSHSSSFQPWSQAASSARSSNESRSMAVLIWSTLTGAKICKYALHRNGRAMQGL